MDLKSMDTNTLLLPLMLTLVSVTTVKRHIHIAENLPIFKVVLVHIAGSKQNLNTH